MKVETKRTIAGLDEFMLRGQANGNAVKGIAGAMQYRLAEGVARNAASVPARWIPHVRMGVSLSMTTLDIRDACSTMEDINGLFRTVGQGEQSPDICGK